ncbi:hypothetical protein MMC18_004832 [Xylographa bjoerkii]|nr:hypothetical protein [Xylographa bjoerkii]
MPLECLWRMKYDPDQDQDQIPEQDNMANIARLMNQADWGSDPRTIWLALMDIYYQPMDLPDWTYWTGLTGLDLLDWTYWTGPTGPDLLDNTFGHGACTAWRTLVTEAIRIDLDKLGRRQVGLVDGAFEQVTLQSSCNPTY